MNTTERDVPSEIYLKIFENLDFKTLLGCMRLSKTFLDLITNSTILQFIIELGIANQVQGEPSSSAEGLEQLRRHQRAREKASWYRSFSLPQHEGPWALYGGVLADVDTSNTFHFTRLPSDLRGTPREEWKVSLPEEFQAFYDFAMDPSQDLLVTVGLTVITDHTAACEFEVHLLELKTGSPHPLIQRNVPLSLSLDTTAIPTCSIQVVGDSIVMLVSQSALVGGADNDLVVWDWKKGSQVAHIYGGLMSYSPLGPTTVLITTWDQERAPLLATIDFDKEGPTRTHLRDATSAQYFGMPTMGPEIEFSFAEVRSDPGPLWRPQDAPGVSFIEDVRNRMYVLTYWYSRFDYPGVHHTYSFQQLIPSKRFILANPKGNGTEPAHIHSWDTWGAGNKSLLRRPDHTPSKTWGCHVYGQRHIALADTQYGKRVAYTLFDFNEHMYRRSHIQALDPSQVPLDRGDWGPIPGPHMFDSDPPFYNRARTSLLGRCKGVVLEDACEKACWPMISEDNLVLVDERNSLYHIYVPSKESP